MNIKKLARFLCGELPNSKAIPIADFVNVLENNLDFDDDKLNNRKHKSGSFVYDYKQLLGHIYDSNQGEGKIYNILEFLLLPQDFISSKDFSQYECKSCGTVVGDIDQLRQTKSELLKEFETTLSSLKKSKNNKANGNKFESLSEKFLLNTGFFESGYKEFSFEDGTGKIDRLLKLKKHIIPHIEDKNFGYVILESKYKTANEVSAGDTGQFKEYIERLNDYGMCNYAISITSNGFKETYKTKLGVWIQKNTRDGKLFVSLIDAKEIIEFLKNKGEYEDMNFDEFIERSFVKWFQ